VLPDNIDYEMYKEIIDELANMSKDCADARGVKKGKLPGTDAEQMGMNDILKKLNDTERDILAELIIDVYHSGIYDTLEKLEWLRCCKNMELTVEGEKLPLDKYEGIPNDYIGRRSDWEWPEED
jgi:hypothetical protein